MGDGWENCGTLCGMERLPYLCVGSYSLSALQGSTNMYVKAMESILFDYSYALGLPRLWHTTGTGDWCMCPNFGPAIKCFSFGYYNMWRVFFSDDHYALCALGQLHSLFKAFVVEKIQ